MVSFSIPEFIARLRRKPRNGTEKDVFCECERVCLTQRRSFISKAMVQTRRGKVAKLQSMRKAQEEEARGSEEQASTFSIELLPEGILVEISSYLEPTSLGMLDCTGKTFYEINCNSSFSAWREMGNAMFAGRELLVHHNPDKSELFDVFNDPQSSLTEEEIADIGDINWKKRVLLFSNNLNRFRSPFDGSEISNVKQSDEVSYMKCRFRTDQIKKNQGLYMEVNVESNADNLSLAVVDFDDDGKSSVTFSPDTGAVIKETKIQEHPRRVKGWYIQPLKHIPPRGNNTTTPAAHRNERFEGKMGIYIKDDKIAFFRKYVGSPKAEWECTGFIIGLDWAKGCRLTPCLAFRDDGAYKVSISQISDAPPQMANGPCKLAERYFKSEAWQELNWEGNGA